VHEAGLHDKEGGKLLLQKIDPAEFPRLEKLWTDQGFAGLKDWASDERDWDLEVARRRSPELVFVKDDDGQQRLVLVKLRGFQVIPRRWVVERTFAWLSRNRRLSKDYEQLPESEEAFMQIAMIRILLNRFEESG
jgi:putative transposase